MAKGSEVLEFLCAGKEWTIFGNDYNSIIWHEGEPYITEAEYEAGFAQVDAWKAEQDAAKAAAKVSAEAKLEALGLTAEDLKALGL